ncbi:DUF1704 domain-containing protein [Candidatus Woesearchaeota archaeon]|nr:DUF1704 domain-containing protein [Candidatus Woesearchaeota archaeon]
MDLHDIDQALFEVWEHIWNLKYLLPVNAQEERDKFFSSEDYEPQFKYRDLDFDVVEYKEKLQILQGELENYDEPIAVLLSQKIEKLISWLCMLENRGTPEFTKHSLAYYGTPTPELITKAETLLSLKGSAKRQTISAEQAAAMLQEEANKLGLQCQVKVKKGMASRADCVMPEHTLYLRADAEFCERDVKKLAVHELGVHALRAYRGQETGWKLFVIGTAEYETTEEGLAGFKEEAAGVSSKKSLKTKGGLVMSVHWSLEKGFRQVYELLREHFVEESAYRLATKSKRGLGDTSKAGAFTKDYIYLKGLGMVTTLSDKEREKLFIGRVAIEDLPVLSKF